MKPFFENFNDYRNISKMAKQNFTKKLRVLQSIRNEKIPI